MLSLLASPLLYCAGSAGYAVHFVRGGQRSGRVATGALLLGAALQVLAYSGAGGQLIRCPVESAAGFLSLAALVVVLLYLPMERHFHHRAMGLVMAPMAAVLLVAAVVLDAPQAPRSAVPLLTSGWFGVHVLGTLVAYAGFTFSAATALMHVLLQRKLSTADMGLVFSRFPDLATLDRMTFRGIVVALPALTVGIASGIFWAIEALPGGWVTDPKILSSFASWAVYGALLVGRARYGWRGQRSAYLSMAGFAVMLASLALGLAASQVHSFR